MEKQSFLKPEGMSALRDFCVSTYERAASQEEKSYPSTRVGEGRMHSFAVSGYLPFLGDALGWYDTLGLADYADPYVAPPLDLPRFMEVLATLSFPSSAALASSMSVTPDGSSSEVRKIPLAEAEAWKDVARQKCEAASEGYESFLLFYPDSGAFWIVSNYEVDQKEVEWAPDRASALDALCEAHPELDEESILSNFFA